jgi:Arc/MetJ-type ribon-helix-helix transcriptional regulator
MTIHLPHEVENGVLAAVHSGHFASVDDAMTEAASMLIQRLKNEQIHAPSKETGQPADAQAQKPIWEKFQDIAASIPKEVWDKIPADSSEQLDHYLYGTPRRPAG